MSSSKSDTEAIRRSDAENDFHVFPLSALRPQEKKRRLWHFLIEWPKFTDFFSL